LEKDSVSTVAIVVEVGEEGGLFLTSYSSFAIVTVGGRRRCVVESPQGCQGKVEQVSLLLGKKNRADERGGQFGKTVLVWKGKGAWW